MKETNFTIDASGKKLGRVASEAARYLMGKNRTDYVRNKEPQVKVVVLNAGKISLTDKKKATNYVSYSGYHRVDKTMGRIIEKKGVSEVVRLAVRGMLPGNKLRPRMLKNLTVTE